jgi:hypothetical protein
MVRTLLATAMMFAVIAPTTTAQTGIDQLAASGYSRVVLERLPSEDLASIVAALDTPSAECRPSAAMVAC